MWRAQETADFRRKPKIFAENRRKPQFGLRHLRCVTFSLALDSGQDRWSTPTTSGVIRRGGETVLGQTLVKSGFEAVPWFTDSENRSTKKIVDDTTARSLI